MVIETYDELCERVNRVYRQNNDVDQTANDTGLSRLVVLESLGFTDEWAFIFDDG